MDSNISQTDYGASKQSWVAGRRELINELKKRTKGMQGADLQVMVGLIEIAEGIVEEEHETKDDFQSRQEARNSKVPKRNNH